MRIPDGTRANRPVRADCVFGPEDQCRREPNTVLYIDFERYWCPSLAHYSPNREPVLAALTVIEQHQRAADNLGLAD